MHRKWEQYDASLMFTLCWRGRNRVGKRCIHAQEVGAVPSVMESDLQSEKFVSIWDKNLPSCCHYCGLPSTAACKMIGKAMTFSTSLTANIQPVRCLQIRLSNFLEDSYTSRL